jgi:archaemetzincin
MRLFFLALIFFAATAQAQSFTVVFLDNCNPSIQDSICQQLSTYFKVPVKRTTAPFPAISQREDGWDAKSLTEACARLKTDSVKRLVVITSRDLYASKDAASSWGVFGYSRYNPGIAVVSTHRLLGSNLVERTMKIAVHEITHTYGVGHCTEAHCLMTVSNGYITELDQKKLSLCDYCRALALRWPWD